MNSCDRIAFLAKCALAAIALIVAAAPAMAGCNSGSTGTLLTSPDCQASAAGLNATVVGYQAFGAGENQTIMGYRAGPPGSLGVGATNIGAHSGFSLGGNYSTAIGGSKSIANQSYAAGHYSIAIGGGDGTVFTPAIGPAINLNGARANGFISIAIGTAAVASGGGSSAFGLGSKAIGVDSAAYGEFSTAEGARSIAMGLFSSASGISSLALGHKATATKTRSVALGASSVANIANTVSVGSTNLKRRIVNVAPGVRGTDAVNVAQLNAAVAAVAAGASPAAVAVPGATEPPAVSVVRVGDAGYGIEDVRRELAELRALVRQQQQRMAHLEGRSVAAAK